MKHLSRHSQRHNAFTLLEIVVVLSVIGILSAILMAVFVRVREGGRRTACESNLHQIGLALQQYTSDNNGFYPQVTYSTLSNKVKWSDLLQPYLKSAQVFDCLSHTEQYPACSINSLSPASSEYGLQPEYTGDYFYNWYNIREGGHWRDDKSEMRISRPEKVPLVFDAGWVTPAGEPRYMQQVGTYGSNGQLYQLSAHAGGANFVFADGHLKWLSANQQANEYDHVGSYAHTDQ